MDFEIVEAGEAHGSSAIDPLDELLSKCPGAVRVASDVKAVIEGPTKMWAFNGPKVQTDGLTTALGGVYWVSKEAVMRASRGHVVLDKFQSFAEGLVLEPKTTPGQWAPRVKAYYENKSRPDVIGLPRFFGLSMFGQPKQDIRSNGTAIESMINDVPLRDIQQRAVRQTLDTLKYWGGAFVIADCGFGKTRVAVALTAAIGRKTLILCNREVLMLQWADVLAELQPSWRVSWLQGSDSFVKPSVRVGTGASARIFLGANEPADVTIGSIDTLVDANVPKELLQQFGLVVVDEAHHLAAATLVHALPLLPARNIVGLSATPDRRDGLEHAVYWLAGPVSFVYKRLPSITGIHGAVQVRKVMPRGCGQHEKMYSNGQMAFAEMTTALAEDPKRNRIIVEAIVAELAAGRRKIMVVSALVAHCVALRDAVVKATSGSSAGAAVTTALMAGANVESVKAKSADTRVVFATYMMLEEGYDDNRLDTLVLTTPRSRVQQTIGRVERTHEGKLTPLVIDITDPFSVYPNMWYKRQQFYKSRGFTIEMQDAV